MKKEKWFLVLVVFFLFVVGASAVADETNEILINEFVVEPQVDWSGDDSVSTLDEWIELYNPGLGSVDLEGWHLELIDSSNSTQALSVVIPSGGYFVVQNPPGHQENNGRLELYDDSGLLVDSVTYGDYDDGDISDNAEDGDSTSVFDECLARFPNGADTGVDRDDFVKTACTRGGENNVSFVPVSLVDLPVQPACALETDDVTIQAEISGSVVEVSVAISIDGEVEEFVLSEASGGIYSYTILASELEGSATVEWQFSVVDVRGNVTRGSLNSLHINSITSLLIFPAVPNGYNGWYVSEPQFELFNSEAMEINYRWNGFYFTYSSPFGLEGTPNGGNVTGGTQVLAYKSEYGDPDCIESEKEFVGKFDFADPQIEDVYPSPNSTVFNEPPVTVHASIDEVYQGNSGVNLSSVLMEINGESVPVVAEAAGTIDAEVTYAMNFTDGQYEVYLYVEDNAGRFSTKTWTFDLVTPADFDLEINYPEEGIYMDRRQRFNLTLTREAEEILFINYDDPNPRFRRLCKDCDGFGHDRDKFRLLREGENNLEFQAIGYDGDVKEKTVVLTVDSKNPRIVSTSPKSGFASGVFGVQFSEESPSYLIITYGNSEVGFVDKQVDLSEECQKDRDYFCFTEVDLTDYDGHGIEYYVTLGDVAGNVDESRPRTLDVDVSEPIIDSLSVDVDGKYAMFMLEIEEPYLKEVVYVDSFDGEETEKRLCGELQFGTCQKRVSLRDGEHNVTVIVRDEAGNEVSSFVDFFIDSRVPKIKRTEPRRGFASGNFVMTFEEANPSRAFINYGNFLEMKYEEVDLSACEVDRKNTVCSVEVNLSDFEEQEVTYWFNLTDISGDSDESIPRQLKVDATPPDVFFFNHTLVSRAVELVVGVADPNFERIIYRDLADSNPRFKTLCSRLKDGFCEKTKRFRTGEHVLEIVAVDEAGNEAVVARGLEFVV